jgi:hypothetical protein
MAARPPDDLLPTTPFLAHASLEAQLAELPVGWDAAKAWRQLRGQVPPALRHRVLESAIDGVLAQARRLVRHAARPTRKVRAAWPDPGELDLAATLDALPAGPVRPGAWSAGDLVLERTEPRDVDVVAILDMSLSMTGEKIALLAVATAILRMRLEHVAVVAFDTTPHVLVRTGEAVGVRELVRRVLGVPAQGYTNIEGGLDAGLRELRASRRRERVGMLFSDGVANVGWDPVPVAGRFPRLHVVHLGAHHVQGTRTCQGMARAGRGKLYRARTYADLPTVVRGAVRELFRGGG